MTDRRLIAYTLHRPETFDIHTEHRHSVDNAEIAKAFKAEYDRVLAKNPPARKK